MLSNGAESIDYLCTYTLMVISVAPQLILHLEPSLSRTLVRPPPPSTTIAAHLRPLQPPYPHLALPIHPTQ